MSPQTVGPSQSGVSLSFRGPAGPPVARGVERAVRKARPFPRPRVSPASLLAQVFYFVPLTELRLGLSPGSGTVPSVLGSTLLIPFRAYAGGHMVGATAWLVVPSCWPCLPWGSLLRNEQFTPQGGRQYLLCYPLVGWRVLTRGDCWIASQR